jgi:serine/threonine protein phosphatase PrpC
MTCENRALTIISGSMIDKGKVRRSNEDSILLSEFTLKHNESASFLGCYGVADGMGGYECGEVASRLALVTFANHLIDLPTRLITQFPNNRIIPAKIVTQELNEGVRKANTGIYSTALANRNTMGTTLATALVVNDAAYIANIGDSRVYLLHEESLQQVTSDHSYVAELVAAGRINPEDIYTHPHRNIITRYLGMEKDIFPDIFIEKLTPSDVLLLCSDGLWEMVNDTDIESIMKKSPDPQAICSRLIEAANINGGTDNISVIVVLAKTTD